MFNEVNSQTSNPNQSQTASSSTPILSINIESITPPSILLKSHSTFTCSNHSREKKVQCKFDQLSYAFKKVLISCKPFEHRINGTGFLYSKRNLDRKPSESKSEFKINQKRKSLQTQEKKVNEEIPSNHPNLPSIKFAPLPKIKNRHKKSNTISMGVSARSKLIQQMKNQEQDLTSKRYSLPMQEPIQWTNTTNSIKSEKEVSIQSDLENKVRRRPKNQESSIKDSSKELNNQKPLTSYGCKEGS